MPAKQNIYLWDEANNVWRKAACDADGRLKIDSTETGGGGGGGYTEGAKVKHSAAQTIPHETTVALAFDTEIWDTDGMHDCVTNNSRVTCQTAGKYHIAGIIGFLPNNTGIRWLCLRKNGTDKTALIQVNTTIDADSYLAVNTIDDLSVGDYYELCAYQKSGGNLDTTGGCVRCGSLALQRIG